MLSKDLIPGDNIYKGGYTKAVSCHSTHHQLQVNFENIPVKSDTHIIEIPNI